MTDNPRSSIAAHPLVVQLARHLATRGRATTEPVRGPSTVVRLGGALVAEDSDTDTTEVVEEHVAGYRMAAVVLVLRLNRSGALELLFIARAPYASDPWSAQVAFPGGRAEPGDQSLEATALREVYEETGLDLSHDGRVLGVLDDVTPSTVRLPAIVVRPFVAIAERETGHVSPASPEIGATFWVPLSMLQAEGVWREVSVVAQGVTLQVPAIQYEEYVIWGLTARILRQFLAITAKGSEGEHEGAPNC